MATKIDQKAYLQKYLSGSSGEKKKKKKVTKGKGFTIIDDDVDISKMRPLEGDELDILGEGEDAPQIAGIIDERPEEVKKLEQFKTSSKWRVINQDDGFNSKLQIEEIKKNIKEVQKENEIVFGKMYSDSEDEKKNDSDVSPPRRQPKENASKSKKAQNNSDSDFSPPRKSNRETSPRKKSENRKYDSDFSPARKHESRPKERRKASRWGDIEKEETKSRQISSDFDASPPRKRNHVEIKNYKRNNSPSNSKSDTSKRKHSPKARYSSGSDVSPPRKSHKSKNISPLRKSRRDSPKQTKSSKYDVSPLRKEHFSEKHKSTSYGNKNERYKNNTKYEERHRNSKYEKPQNYRSDSDASPPRKKRQKSPSPKRSRKSPEKQIRKHDSDSDLSPPRKDKSKNSDKVAKIYRRNSDSPPPSNKKMAKTLEGKKAGLQDATQLREENESFRRKEEEAFRKLSDEISGRNAQAVSRKGKRETSEERHKQKEKAEKQKELDEKYQKWSKGVKQVEAQQARVQEFLHEAAKPLARHRDDKDLENNLRQIERAGDPMLQYMREKKRERGELGPEKPTYKGNFPPNRFNIRPGYRWDGVDRSNGYEKKYFEHQSKRKAQEEEAYKWSTEDL